MGGGQRAVGMIECRRTGTEEVTSKKIDLKGMNYRTELLCIER